MGRGRAQAADSGPLFEARPDGRTHESLRQYRLDVRKVDPHEIADMLKVLRKMNFDARFRLVV